MSFPPSTSSPGLPRRFLLLVAAIIAVFLLLALLTARIKRPNSDEGWFASTGRTLAFHGYMGTPVIEDKGSGLNGIHERTYHTMPFFYLLQAVWYKLVGFSLWTLRGLSAVLGAVSLLCWLFILRRLSGRWRLALLAMAFIASDYYFIQLGSFGRYDMTCQALGAAAAAVYILLRERHMVWAVFLSQSLAAASGMTHFMGLAYFVWLLTLTLSLDWRRVRLRHVLAGAAPYLIGGALWYSYIQQSPADFQAQFHTNATSSGRLLMLRAPLEAISNEIRNRYLLGFGLGTHSSSHSGPIFLKALILFAWLAGVAAALLFPTLRRRTDVRLLLAAAFLLAGTMAVLDGHNQTWYLVHMTPPFAALLAVLVDDLWERRIPPRILIATGVAGLIALQIGGTLLRVRLNVYDKEFTPAISYLLANTTPEQMIIASADIGFGIGFERNLVDDIQLGFASGKRPEWIVQDGNWLNIMDIFRTERPPVFAYMQRLFAEEYRLVYDENGYKIWRRIQRSSP
jgi:4-amino-4-deoxy-L-arabinose transferase-like glycosyltransferase